MSIEICGVLLVDFKASEENCPLLFPSFLEISVL